MKHHILNQDGDIIASFVNKFDREVCLDALEEEFPDCEFSIKDDE